MTDWKNDPERVTFLAATHTRGKNVAFGIRAKDRDKHMYILGKSGMGKSTLLENMAIQDIQNGEGMIFIDPHGSTAEKLLDFVPQDRIKDTLYLAPFDTDNPVGFNILEDVGYDNRHKVVAGLMGVFERIWADAWSARMQYILQNTLFALLEYPGATIIDVNRMLVNKAFREDVINHITDPVVAMFWKEEFAGYSDKYTQDATPAIQNKIGQFVSNPLIRNILGQAKSSFDIRKMMDERKIIIINLSKGRMGEANAALLGSMLVIKVYLSALTRAEESAVSMAKLPQCYFYVDEFQNVVSRAFENILSESRKYKLCLTIANQYIEQMPEEVRNAVFGNVGTTIIFRVGPMDAQFLEPVFGPTFLPEDMVGLGLGDIYLTLMIDGVGTAPFSAHTLAPVLEPSVSFKDDIITWTRARYGRVRADVEKEVREAGEKWQDAAREKHKADSSRGQQKSTQKPFLRQEEKSVSSYGTRPRTVSAPTVDQYQQRGHIEAKTLESSQEERHEPPASKEPVRSPAEVLRSMHPVREDVRKPAFLNVEVPQTLQQQPAQTKHQVSDAGRDALKAAIASARVVTQDQHQYSPRPAQQSQTKSQTHEQRQQSLHGNPRHPYPRYHPRQSTSQEQVRTESKSSPQNHTDSSSPAQVGHVRDKDRDEPTRSGDVDSTRDRTRNESATPNGVDPKELHKLLYGDDEQTFD